MKKFEGKTVIVTGAGKNIGKQISLDFASQGANVVVCDYNEDNANQTVAEIEALGVSAMAAVCDVRDREKVFEYVNAVRCRNANTFILSGLSISEAAYRCGFENMSYFSKTFKKYVGKLPSKVGRNNKNTAINSD